VPVAFALTAGVLVGNCFTDVRTASIIQQMFNGVDSEALLAIPFFILVGCVMEVNGMSVRLIELIQVVRSRPVEPEARDRRGHLGQHLGVKPRPPLIQSAEDLFKKLLFGLDVPRPDDRPVRLGESPRLRRVSVAHSFLSDLAVRRAVRRAAVPQADGPLRNSMTIAANFSGT